MEQQELKEWRDFCEGRKPHTPMMFSNMFMGMFVEPLGETDRNDLRTIFSYIRNSSGTLEKLLRIGTPARKKSEKELADLVVRDLNEMRRIIDNPKILASVDLGVGEITADEARFRQVFEANLNMQFADALTDYYGQIKYKRDEVTGELCDAFYGIGCNLHLQLALAADLVGANVSFSNYFELYLSGADYALDTNGALVFSCRT